MDFKISIPGSRSLSPLGSASATRFQGLQSINGRKESAVEDAVALNLSAQRNKETSSDKAARSISDASSFISIAQEAAKAIDELLAKAQELTASLSTTTNDAEKEAIGGEIVATLAEIDEVAAVAEFKGNPVIDGGPQTFLFNLNSSDESSSSSFSITVQNLGLSLDSLGLSEFVVEEEPVSEIQHPVGNPVGDLGAQGSQEAQGNQGTQGSQHTGNGGETGTGPETGEQEAGAGHGSQPKRLFNEEEEIDLADALSTARATVSAARTGLESSAKQVTEVANRFGAASDTQREAVESGSINREQEARDAADAVVRNITSTLTANQHQLDPLKVQDLLQEVERPERDEEHGLAERTERRETTPLVPRRKEEEEEGLPSLLPDEEDE